MRRYKPDPPVRYDGLCFVCKGVRPDPAVEHGDPFCSTGCARVFHDTPADASTAIVTTQ